MGVIDNAVQWATDIANDDSHWYSQDVRWGPHYDCSYFCYNGISKCRSAC